MSIDDAYYQFFAIVECDWPDELRAYNGPARFKQRIDYMNRIAEAFRVYYLALVNDTAQHCNIDKTELVAGIEAHMHDMRGDVYGAIAKAVEEEMH